MWFGGKERAGEMKENKYDNQEFFEKYSQMARSVKGLEGAGEWPTLEKMLPDFRGKRVLDLGCGFGWHCQYAMEQGAASAVAIDISEKMLAEARKKNRFEQAEYRQMSIEDVAFERDSFDVVLSSLAFHYVEDFGEIVDRVREMLVPGGTFVFSVEHPVFTSYGNQDWIYDSEGNILYFPVDRYFSEGQRDAVFLGEPVVKYHRTLTTYLGELLERGFVITGVKEPQPTEQMVREIPGMKEELRRPMMLIISAENAGKKKEDQI